jgi:hypothetical protein
MSTAMGVPHPCVETSSEYLKLSTATQARIKPRPNTILDINIPAENGLCPVNIVYATDNTAGIAITISIASVRTKLYPKDLKI